MKGRKEKRPSSTYVRSFESEAARRTASLREVVSASHQRHVGHADGCRRCTGESNGLHQCLQHRPRRAFILPIAPPRRTRRLGCWTQVAPENHGLPQCLGQHFHVTQPSSRWGSAGAVRRRRQLWRTFRRLREGRRRRRCRRKR